MIRNLKALGLALVAMLAMGALAVSAASAAEFKSDGDFVTVEGTAAEADQSLSVGTLTSRCKEEHFHGVVEGEAATHYNAITVTPTYTNPCVTNTQPTTVTFNGCDYVFHVTGVDPEGGEDTWVGTADLVCPAGKQVEIHLYATSATHESNTSLCTITIPAQNGLAGITYKVDTGPPHTITVSGAVEPALTVDKNSIVCPSATKGKITISKPLKLKGTNAAKEETSIFIG